MEDKGSFMSKEGEQDRDDDEDDSSRVDRSKVIVMFYLLLAFIE